MIQMKLLASTQYVLLTLKSSDMNGYFFSGGESLVKQSTLPLCISFFGLPSSPLAHQNGLQRSSFSLEGKTDGSPRQGVLKEEQ